MGEEAGNAKWPKGGYGRGCLIAAVIALALVVLLVLFANRQLALQIEADQAKWRQKAFDDAKSGNNSPSIFDAKTIELLASDADCIRNVTHLQFSGVNFEDVDLSAAHKLVNVKCISFYDCAYPEALFRAMQDMPSVEAVGWESTYVPDEGIRALAEFPNLKRVGVQDIVSDSRERLLHVTLPNVELNIPYPERNERK